MASYKDTFESWAWRANTFASGAWRGVGVSGYLNTAGIFTVTNITGTRSLSLTTATINDLANLVGTCIYDIQAGTWNGASYSITGSTADREYDPSETLLVELLNAAATAIADNPGTTTFFARYYVFATWTVLYTMNCLVTSLEELARLIATWLDWRTPDKPGLEFTLPLNALDYTLPANVLEYSLPVNALHYTLPD